MKNIVKKSLLKVIDKLFKKYLDSKVYFLFYLVFIKNVIHKNQKY